MWFFLGEKHKIILQEVYKWTEEDADAHLFRAGILSVGVVVGFGLERKAKVVVERLETEAQRGSWIGSQGILWLKSCTSGVESCATAGRLVWSTEKFLPERSANLIDRRFAVTLGICKKRT